MKRPDLPLAAAAARLRGKPGRPRKHPQSGHVPGRPQVPADAGLRVGALAQSASVHPALLDLKGASKYLSISVWGVRDLIAAGTLPRIQLPLPGGRVFRKVLVSVADLDRLILTSRETGP